MDVKVIITQKTLLNWATTKEGDEIYHVILDTGQIAYINQANMAVHPVDIIKK
jgi:hypothetical protein